MVGEGPNGANSGMNGPRTRPSLLLRLRDFQDRKSWEEFVELYGPLILRYLLHVGVARQEALDLVQDVLWLVVRNIRHFEYDPLRGRFRDWLKTIARNRAYRFFAQRSRRPLTPGGTTHAMAIQETPCEDAAQDELIETEWRRRRFELAVKRVRPKCTEQTWQAFELQVVYELSAPEVAERLGMSRGAVHVAKCRVLARLRQAVEEIDE